MKQVRLFSEWLDRWQDGEAILSKLTPGGNRVWEDVRFTFAPIDAPDYAVAFHNPKAYTTTLRCPPEHVWAVMQEPPGLFSPIHRSDRCYARVYTCDESLQGSRYIHRQPPFPWLIERDYDYLRACAIPPKEQSLSFITSTLAHFPGHRRRLAFLERIRPQLDFDLYGRGFAPIEDKWDALAPYRYSIVVENYSGPYYWSEKLADCLLAWTLPIYYGATNISDYLPSEAMVCIDVDDPLAVDRIREVVNSALWQQRLDAIAEARQLILNAHQPVAFLAGEIRAHERQGCAGLHVPRRHTLYRTQRSWSGRLLRHALSGVPRPVRDQVAEGVQRRIRGHEKSR